MKTATLGIGTQYDSGKTSPVIAMNKYGDVLSVSCDAWNNLYYYVGKVNGAVIDWGSPQSYVSGAYSSIALNDKGQFVEVHRTSNIFGSSLWWYTGSINTSTKTLTHGNGFEQDSMYGNTPPSVALSNANVFAAAVQHSASHINCYVGAVSGHTISSFISVEIITGTKPAIAFNEHGSIILVYFNASMILCYRVGQLENDNTSLTWGAEMTVGSTPLGTSQLNILAQMSVAYTNDAIIIVYPNGDSDDHLCCICANHSGWGADVVWADPVPYDQGITPSVAANATYAAEVHKSENYSDIYYSVCLITDHARWMENLNSVIGGRTLGQIVMPAAHDAGMYEDWTTPSARTQDLTIYGQLMNGMRFFDLRVDYDSTGTDYEIYHGPLLDNGGSLDDVLDDIADYMANQQSKELVILKFSHFNDFGSDSGTNNIYLNFTKRICDTLGSYLCTNHNSETKFGSLTFNQILGGSGKVLVVCDGNYEQNNPRKGIFTYRDGSLQCPQEARSDNPTEGNLVVWDCYSNTTDYNTMKTDQLNKLSAYTGYCDGNYTNTPCDMFLLSWTLTPWVNSVWNDSVNPARYLGSVMNTLQPNSYGKIPNLLYVNYVEYSRATDIAIMMNQGVLPVAS